MMGGLAYMTGPEGRPLRAGTSVNDIMGGMFGAIGALAALRAARADRPRPGGAERAVREQRVPGRAAHDAVRGHRQAGRADAEPHLGLGGLRRVHGQGRRADLPRRGERHAVGAVLRRVRLRRPAGRPAPGEQQRSACRRASGCCRMLRERLAPRSARPSCGAAFEAHRPAVRADHPARGPVRRPAPACDRRPRAGHAAGRRERRRPRDRRRAPRCCRSRWTAQRPALRSAAAGARRDTRRAAARARLRATPRSTRCARPM